MEEFVAWLEQSWAILAAAIGCITLVWNFLNKTLKEMKESVNKPFAEINKRFDDIEEKIDNKHRNDDIVISALLSMQRGDILADCERYIKQGYATLHQKEALQARFESYQQLGGNSFIHELMEQVQDLPIEKTKKSK